MELTVRIPASTSNLGPGFDALGLALGIYNTVTVRTREEAGVRFSVLGEGAGRLPEDGSNLFYRAAKVAAEETGTALPGLDIRMHNGVPLNRGLGSSASAVVGGMVVANRIAGDPLSRSEILDLATRMEGHPDNVSPCLMGGLTVSSVDNGKVTCVRPDPPAELRVVVAVPDFEIETHAARALLPDTVPHRDAVFNVSRSAMVTAALITGQLDALKTALDDRLHQPYRLSLVPGFEAVRGAAVRAGALGAFLSGAGPTILAFAQTNAEGVADAMKGAWRENGVIASADVVEIDPIGVTLE